MAASIRCHWTVRDSVDKNFAGDLNRTCRTYSLLKFLLNKLDAHILRGFSPPANYTDRVTALVDEISVNHTDINNLILCVSLLNGLNRAKCQELQ
jgi:hypothetical protein